MGLSNDLISQFVKVTNDKQESNKKETIVYGTTVEFGGAMYVIIDGSEILTPASTTADVKSGERVTVMIKNHTAIITGNVSSPSASSKVVDELGKKFDNLDPNLIIADNAIIKEKLVAQEAIIGTLQTDVGTIDTLIFGSATGNVIQTSFSNAVIAQLGNAQIKSAMIESVSAGKITAGDIITNNVRVKSQNGLLLISDETIQISDTSRVRVQIGKDASNDYSINVWDTNGNLMFSKGGITDSAIKQAIIRNDMVSDTANIAAHKLDIDSLFEEINDSSNTIKSTKIYLDDKKQTLDVAFKSLETAVTGQGETISSQGTAISVIQGQISSKIWQQDINTAKGEMSTQYSELSQELGSFKTTVGNTYATKESLNTANSSISQLSTQIVANVTETTRLGTRMSTVEQTADGLTAELDDLEVGGRNLILNSGFKGVSNTQYIVFDSTNRMMTCTSSELNRTYTVVRSLSAYGLSKMRATSITMSGEYMVESDLTYGTTNPWIGMELSVQRNTTTGGSSQWLAWLGSKPNIDKTASNKWTKVSSTWNISDFGTSVNPSLAIILRDFTGAIKFRNLKIEFGNRATDWTPAPEDIDGYISDASKTATNYLSFSSSGLVIGDMTASTLGKNVLIDSDSIDVRNGTTTLASFGADYLYLAKNSRNATIDLCNGLAKLYHQSRLSYDTLFVIETPNATEIRGTSDPLCVTSTVASKPAIRFANASGVLGSIGMVASGTESYITRNHPSTAATYSILDTGNYYKLMDSGWFYLPVDSDSNFTIYDNGTDIRYRKIGKIVEIDGAIKPKVEIAGSTTNYSICTLPTGYRPSQAFQVLSQGSGANSWLFSITTGGLLRFSRYNNGSGYITAPVGTWLPIHAIFFTD